MANYWISNGKNTLKGVPGDSSNPPVLTDAGIINAIQISRKARRDLDLLFDGLLPDEQARLQALMSRMPTSDNPTGAPIIDPADNPKITQLRRDEGEFTDDIQKRQVTASIRTVGPRGGLGGPSRSSGKVI